MLLWMCKVEVDEFLVDLAGDVALEAADDVASAEALGLAALGVGAGGGVPAESADGDAVEGGVGGSVAGSVEAVSVGVSAGCGDG
jgi:hypothetical protein